MTDSLTRKLPQREFRDSKRWQVRYIVSLYVPQISGMYLGEIVRLILVDLISNAGLFDGKYRDKLSVPFTFDTAYMSRIERDHSADLRDVSSLLSDLLKIHKSTVKDRQVLKRICELVGVRSSRLCAAGIAVRHSFLMHARQFSILPTD